MASLLLWIYSCSAQPPTRILPSQPNPEVRVSELPSPIVSQISSPNPVFICQHNLFSVGEGKEISFQEEMKPLLQLSFRLDSKVQGEGLEIIKPERQRSSKKWLCPQRDEWKYSVFLGVHDTFFYHSFLNCTSTGHTPINQSVPTLGIWGKAKGWCQALWQGGQSWVYFQGCPLRAQWRWVAWQQLRASGPYTRLPERVSQLFSHPWFPMAPAKLESSGSLERHLQPIYAFVLIDGGWSSAIHTKLNT